MFPCFFGALHSRVSKHFAHMDDMRLTAPLGNKQVTLASWCSKANLGTKQKGCDYLSQKQSQKETQISQLPVLYCKQ